MPLDPDSDPFRPPAIPTEVGCLHCQQEYESYLIEWRVFVEGDGKEHGFWCCPTSGCDGKGFGFDIFPTDPTYRDENGDLIYSDDGEEEIDEDTEEAPPPDEEAPGKNGDPPRRRASDDNDLPW